MPLRQATWTILLYCLFTHFPIPGLAEWRSPSPPANGSDYSPPMETVLVVIIALFFAVGLLSIFFRHFSICLGYGNNRPAPITAGAWPRNEARGLHPSEVDSFPTFPYSDVKVHRIGKGTLECAVCLCEFSDDDVLKMLPVCSHVFHLDCITPWLASHVTCPVCRANLKFQHPRMFFDTLLEHLHQLPGEESQPSDQINDHDNHDDGVTARPSPDHTIAVKTPVHEIKDGEGSRGKLLRSHSTGHSLVGDCERYTLRLPEEVRNKLVTANQSNLPAMISPRIGYRARSVGCTGFPAKPERWQFSASPPFISRTGSTSSISNSAGIMSGPKSIFKSIQLPLNRGQAPRYTSDIGERSSDKLWATRRDQDLESDGQ